MALKIRLARGGAKKRPYYRIVVAEATAPRDGRYVEKVGTYNPMLPREHEDRIRLVEDRIKHWISVGAKPTDRVAKFLGDAKIIEMPGITEKPQKSKPKAKAQEREREKAEKIEAAKAAEKEAAEAAKAAEAEAAAAAKAEAEKPAEEAAPAEEAKAEEAPAEAAAEEKPAEEKSE
ncbi:MAG: 30S ribosomal protein S16 [Alphaproteobacteria bacterium]